MKKIFLLLLLPLLATSQNDARKVITSTLDAWHRAASEANYADYFDAMADDAVFIGTDATENWTKKAFQEYAKPHFDKGKAWSFSCMQRHIYLNEAQNMAWFDELLDTRMKICRGSGVLELQNGQWKIKQYVLSMTIPNDISDAVIKIKAPIEESLISEIKNYKR